MIEEGNLTIIQSEWSILYTEERVGRERGEEFKVAESWSSLCTELIIIFIDSLVLWDLPLLSDGTIYCFVEQPVHCHSGIVSYGGSSNSSSTAGHITKGSNSIS
jgi:hypothetical protein